MRDSHRTRHAPALPIDAGPARNRRERDRRQPAAEAPRPEPWQGLWTRAQDTLAAARAGEPHACRQARRGAELALRAVYARINQDADGLQEVLVTRADVLSRLLPAARTLDACHADAGTVTEAEAVVGFCAELLECHPRTAEAIA